MSAPPDCAVTHKDRQLPSLYRCLIVLTLHLQRTVDDIKGIAALAAVMVTSTSSFAVTLKAPIYHRSPKSSFHAAFESLDGGTRAAIFVGDDEEQLLLIQMPVTDDPGRMEKKFCVYATPSNSPKRLQILDWTDGDQDCKDLFFSSVDRILARDTMVSGQY
ncbi:hypothetical protein AYO21_00081 [Fonsecaea monophora]|uniref:Uncharacterized protein n=1 Tax=Fonsecaea monophora TaxID=254056 RepID=A0A177FMK2_9EURO|nr:hypothetical protein AYO21_00081 [Fonsecaea monophora]OAG45447.1 hypothetical protein AYO21_00081 [Fonsecaea monophora]